MKKRMLLALIAAGALLAGCAVVVMRYKSHNASRTLQIAEQRVAELNDIAVEAYVYLYPLITMDVTRQVMHNIPSGARQGMERKNGFDHMRTFPPAEFRAVVRPNFDTLYSSAWLDVTKEPMMVSVPAIEGRGYVLEMLDMWTDAFATPGKRTSGTGAAIFAVVPAGWKGSLPAGVQRIESPTAYVWIIGRTQTYGPKDYEAVHKIQDEYRITPLSQWGKKVGQPAQQIVDVNVDQKTPPLDQVNAMKADKYFSYGAQLMKLNPPHVTDWSMVARMKRLGIEAGKDFDFEHAHPEVKAALERACVEGLKYMKEKAPTLARVVNGWQMNTECMGVYGNNYLKRAIVALVGLGAIEAQDGIYPVCVADADGKPLQGEYNYVLHFSKDELPPVKAFWSVTMYDAQGFQVANPLNRFSLGSASLPTDAHVKRRSGDDLKYNADGSLDLYFQHTSPGKDKESNWLPSPAHGVLGITMRLAEPMAPALDGRWAPPAVVRK